VQVNGQAAGVRTVLGGGAGTISTNATASGTAEYIGQATASIDVSPLGSGSATTNATSEALDAAASRYHTTYQQQPHATATIYTQGTNAITIRRAHRLTFQQERT